MKIPVYSSTIRRREMDAVLTCMVSEKIGPGEMNLKLVNQVREQFAFDGALALRSPALALKYALTALDVSPGSAIIISALAPAWQYQALIEFGFVPSIVDVHPDTGQMDIVHCEAAVKSGGRVIVLHEALGHIPDLASFLSLGVPLIEDISLSVGAQYQEKLAGHVGVYAILGLEEGDLLTAGGGAVLVSSQKRESVVLRTLAEKAPRTDILADINAALAWVQLKEMPKNTLLRRELSQNFIRSLMQGRHKTVIELSEGSSSCWSFPVILSSGLKEVKQYVNRKEIEITCAFTGSVTEHLGDTLEGCITAKSLLMRCVLFPLYPRLGASNAARIAKVLATLP